MNSTKSKARTAGQLYLALALTGIFSLMYVPSALIVFGDATATANNITSSELLFRTGILTGLISNVIFVFLVLALYRLFKEVNRKQAILMVTLVVISVATSFVNTTNQIAPLIILSGADFWPYSKSLSWMRLPTHLSVCIAMGYKSSRSFGGFGFFPSHFWFINLVSFPRFWVSCS